MNKFINILQFLTRISIKKNVPYERDMGSGLIYFPIVGMIIGVIMTLIYLLLSTLIKNPAGSIIIAVLVVFAEVVITGGLHIDGFGDTFDGIFSYRSKAEILEIMKDPRLGTNGILSVIFLVIFKIVVTYFIISNGYFWVIFLMPMLGRYIGVVLCYKSVPAKKVGMGNMFIGKCDIGTLTASSALVALTIMIVSLISTGSILFSFLALASLPLLYIFAGVFEYFIYRKIDGLTGDVIGCGIELSELIFIIYMLIIIGI